MKIKTPEEKLEPFLEHYLRKCWKGERTLLKKKLKYFQGWMQSQYALKYATDKKMEISGLDISQKNIGKTLTSIIKKGRISIGIRDDNDLTFGIAENSLD